MTNSFETLEEAFIALSDPSNPAWADAFRFLSGHPDTAQLMLATFRETLEQMGVEPSGTDPVTGEPGYRLEDVVRAMGVSEADMDVAIKEPDLHP
jgi:hypothetical protein